TTTCSWLWIIYTNYYTFPFAHSEQMQTSLDVCKTYGSGVFKPFTGNPFYVRTTCHVTLLRFTYKGVICEITILERTNGMMTKVEINVNKIKTVIFNGTVEVDSKRYSLPYDQTYQHIFDYGIYTKLRSKILPLTVTWHNAQGGIPFILASVNWLIKVHVSNPDALIKDFVYKDSSCLIQDVDYLNLECDDVFSHTMECFQEDPSPFMSLCSQNINGFETNTDIFCSFFNELNQTCVWDYLTNTDPTCPGDLIYYQSGSAYQPTCSNPTSSDQEGISTCLCPQGKLLNNRDDGYHCVPIAQCPCVYEDKKYVPGETRETKCQTCNCVNGEWECSENTCQRTCIIESHFVTTFDGRQYSLPGKCTYVAISFRLVSRFLIILIIYYNIYCTKIWFVFVTFSGNISIFWQSSMYVQITTYFGMNIKVQMSPEIQIYVSLPSTHKGQVEGLCGNYNDVSTDDFNSSAGIVENSAESFALSWAVGNCNADIPKVCINTDNEIFAESFCNVLRDPKGIFAPCHQYVQPDWYLKASCHTNNLMSSLCVAVSNYAKACANREISLGDWEKTTNCTRPCEGNQVFSHAMHACNRTCRALSEPYNMCSWDSEPVEGCGCPEGTHLDWDSENKNKVCVRRADCYCYYSGGRVKPGNATIDGRKCRLFKPTQKVDNRTIIYAYLSSLDCLSGKACVHCPSQYTNDTTEKEIVCVSGCYCPEGFFEDHNGECVLLEECTCAFSGLVYYSGDIVDNNCQKCVCEKGHWKCSEKSCVGKCQVYGNGHYQTFDSNWYQFDGNCQYTLATDGCANVSPQFAVYVESIPCCEAEITCSRNIRVELPDSTLLLSDMMLKVTNHAEETPTFSNYTVGLYIVITVPRFGLTLVWDKHTRLSLQLEGSWKGKVCGLCGNFDSSVTNEFQHNNYSLSPLQFGNSWKAATPPCSDVTQEIFPCQRHSYCAAWAERRCQILRGDIFQSCHLKVDPEAFFQACVLESCSCEFEGKFLGFCTAVAAYAEACSEQGACIKWRTPDLCRM
uniref:VWFD domain-containing protein n=1 Tax=Denticeps clupeoides TaxID=299321 RepID=A0AAY4BJU5_9TELE